MSTIEEMSTKMTIYYSKRDGEIKSFCTGIQNMEYFGADKEDYEVIWDYKVVELDNYVLANFRSFVIEGGELKMKKDTPNKYLIQE